MLSSRNGGKSGRKMAGRSVLRNGGKKDYTWHRFSGIRFRLTIVSCYNFPGVGTVRDILQIGSYTTVAGSNIISSIFDIPDSIYLPDFKPLLFTIHQREHSAACMQPSASGGRLAAVTKRYQP